MSGFDLLPDQARRLREDIEARRRGEDAERCSSNFHGFIRQAWVHVDPANPFVDNWHVGAIAEHLEAVSRGQLPRLIINMPPGFGKSLLLCVFFHAWEWASNPMLRYMTGSFSEEFAVRDSMKTRRLMESDWYQARWGDKFRLGGSDLQSAKGRYENDKTGYRIAFGIKSGIGERADRMFMDDPHQTRQAESDNDREAAVRNYRSTMPSRANNVATAAWVIIMQRLHERDLSGQMMEFGFECLKIPMRYDPTRPWKKILVDFQHVDPRTEYGQLLFPERVPEKEVRIQELLFGPYMTSGQYQQEPSPADGGIFKRKWLCKFWQRIGQNLPPHTIVIGGQEVPTELDSIDPSKLDQAASWDCAFKDMKDSDYVVGQVWGKRDIDRYLLDQVRDRLSFTATLDAVKALSVKWPKAHSKFVEDKANGTAVISTLKTKVPGLTPINPEGGKPVRAQAVSPQFAAGNIWLPHPSNAPWVLSLIEEFVAFPNAAHDDTVDAASQILNQWLEGWQLGLLEFLKQSHEEDQMKAKQESSLRALAGKIPGAKQAIATGDDQVECDRCGSVGVTFQPGQGFRCGDCGLQWGAPTDRFLGPKRGAPMQKLLPGSR